jgi:predicted O-methyltransferase YrrM
MDAPEFGVVQMIPKRKEALARLVGKLDGDFIRAIEVGSYEGASALVIADAIADRGREGGTLICVDPWKPYFSSEPTMTRGVKQMESDLEDGTAFNRFLGNIKHAPDSVRVHFSIGTLAEIISEVSDISVDFIFLDGCHRYTEAKSDIENAKPLVRVGGILCGDDLERKGKIVYEKVYPGREQDMFEGCHAGVTCAVWESFGDVYDDCGIWAMQRTADGWAKPV